jgi:hypothetical protein
LGPRKRKVDWKLGLAISLGCEVLLVMLVCLEGWGV